MASPSASAVFVQKVVDRVGDEARPFALIRHGGLLGAYPEGSSGPGRADAASALGTAKMVLSQGDISSAVEG